MPLDLADLFSQHHLVASHVELSFAPEKQVLNIFFLEKSEKSKMVTKNRTKMKLPLGAFELLHVVKGHVLFPSVKSGQKAN